MNLASRPHPTPPSPSISSSYKVSKGDDGLIGFNACEEEKEKGEGRSRLTTSRSVMGGDDFFGRVIPPPLSFSTWLQYGVNPALLSPTGQSNLKF